MVPIINNRTNEVVGGVGCNVDIGATQGIVRKLMSERSEIAAMEIYASNGLVLGSYRNENVGRMLSEVSDIYGNQLEAVNRAVSNGTPLHLKSYHPSLGTNIEVDIIPFNIGNSDLTWSIMLAMTEDFIMSEVRVMTLTTVIITIIALLLTALTVFIALQYLTKPIVMVADALKNISQGEGDLTAAINISSKDEIGRMSRYFNQTLEKIRTLVIKIRGEAFDLSDIGNDLADNMNKTASSVNEITANIQSIKGRVMNQSSIVNETNATMEHLVVNINNLNDLVKNQSSHISQASSSIEEMAANIRSVTGTLITNTNNVKALREASEVGRSGLQDVSEDIKGIARESEGLLEINSVMQSIASQTNLLSMNAAIEAAHAGNAGKGFAVVADEIRKLAESSGEQSKTIGKVLKKIKESIDKIMLSTENVLNKFEAIDSSVRIVEAQEENIRRAMEEQEQGNKQILDGIGNVNAITRQVENGSSEMYSGAQEVITESSNLEKTTQEIAFSMNEMYNGADQINIAVNHVNDISGKNREAINALLKEVSRFKVE
jgi:methyl-accepting chemotaxis protein